MPLAGEDTMNWSKLPKEKRNQLVLVVLLTLAVVVALGYGLVRMQYDDLASIHRKQDAAEAKLKQMQETIKEADKIAAKLVKAEENLNVEENLMVSGDPTSWFLTTIRGFNKPAYKINIPSFSTILVGDTTLLARFPYKQVMITIGGTGYYHDIGKFISDFENGFPRIRVMNVEISPVSETAAGEKERLNFKMDVVALIKPTNA